MGEAAVAAAAVEAAAKSEQDNWRWCNKCQGLAFAGNPSPGLPAQLVEHTTLLKAETTE
jgi:hypothetical protein